MSSAGGFFLNLPLFRFFTALGQATFLQNKVGTWTKQHTETKTRERGVASSNLFQEYVILCDIDSFWERWTVNMVNDPHQPGNMFQMFHKPGKSHQMSIIEVISACAAASRWRNAMFTLSRCECDVIGGTAALSACGGPILQQFCSNCQFEKSCLICRDPIILPSREYIRPTGQSIMSRRFQGGACEFSRTLWMKLQVTNGTWRFRCCQQWQDDFESTSWLWMQLWVRGPQGPNPNISEALLDGRHGLRFSVSILVLFRGLWRSLGSRTIAIWWGQGADANCQKGSKRVNDQQCVYGCLRHLTQTF